MKTLTHPMKTRIKTLLAFVMLSGALLPISFALPNTQSNINAQTVPQVTVPGIVAPNDQSSSGGTALPNGVPRIDSIVDAISTGAASGAVTSAPDTFITQYFPYAYYVGGNWYWDDQIGYIYPYSNGVCYFYTYGRYYYPGAGSFGYSTGVYIYDFYYGSWTYTSKSLWHWVYYYSFGQWYANDFH